MRESRAQVSSKQLLYVDDVSIGLLSDIRDRLPLSSQSHPGGPYAVFLEALNDEIGPAFRLQLPPFIFTLHGAARLIALVTEAVEQDGHGAALRGILDQLAAEIAESGARVAQSRIIDEEDGQ